jgi:hypothetical protein
VPQASGELYFPPDPPLQARGPTERYDETNQKNASTRLLAVIRSGASAALSRQLPGCGSPLGDDEG